MKFDITQMGVLLSGITPDIVFGAVALNLIIAKTVNVSATNSRSQERTADSLDEGSKAKGGNYNFSSYFNFIQRFKGKKKHSKGYNLLEEVDENTILLEETKSLKGNYSGGGYGSNKNTNNRTIMKL